MEGTPRGHLVHLPASHQGTLDMQGGLPMLAGPRKVARLSEPPQPAPSAYLKVTILPGVFAMV